MDELKIVSTFTRKIVSKIAETFIRKKTGYDIDIRLNNVAATVTGERAHLHLSVDAELGREELTKILGNIGLS